MVATIGLITEPMYLLLSSSCLRFCSLIMFSRYHLPNSLSLGEFLAPGDLGSIDLGLGLSLSPDLDFGGGGATLLGAEAGLDESLLSLDFALLNEDDDESRLHFLLLLAFLI